MDIEEKLAGVNDDQLRTELAGFLSDFMNPAFGSLPKREIELRVFDLLRSLGVVEREATIYSLMTDLKVIRSERAPGWAGLQIVGHPNRTHIGTYDNLNDQRLRIVLMRGGRGRRKIRWVEDRRSSLSAQRAEIE